MTLRIRFGITTFILFLLMPHSVLAQQNPKGDFTVQGITTGMSKGEIKTILTTNGWKFAREWRKTKDNKMKVISIKYHNIQGNSIAGRIEYKLSFLSENFNAADITKILQKKYPAREKGKGYGNRTVYLKEYPNGLTHKEMVLACKGDAIKRGMPAYQALGKAQKVANLANWSKTGDADYKQTCPGVATLWKKYINTYLGKTLDITVAPRRRNERWVKMVVNEQRVYQSGLRYMFEKNQKKKQAQPKATIDSSDL